MMQRRAPRSLQRGLISPALLGVASRHRAASGSAAFFQPAGAAVMTLSNGNLRATFTGTGVWQCARISDRTGSQSYTMTDKRYFEIVVGGSAYFGVDIGFIANSAALVISNPNGVTGVYVAASCNKAGLTPGTIVNGGFGADANYAASLGTVWGVAINGTNGKCYFSKGGTFIGSQNPAADTGPAFTLASLSSCAWITTHDDGSGQNGVFDAHFDTAAMSFSIPSGYKAWNDTN